MRIGELVLIVMLVAGMFLVLSWGIGASNTNEAGNVVLPCIFCGGESCAMDAEASMASGCGGGTPVLGTFVDFSKDGEYALTGVTLKNTGNSLGIYNAAGYHIGAFNISDEGRMVPAGSQPYDVVVKSAYSGPPGDTYSNYRVYPSCYGSHKNPTPIIGVDHSYGYVTITPGGDIVRKNAKSYIRTFGHIESGVDGSSGGCGISSSTVPGGG